ncbi:M48 family metallopeptidase [Chloroflexota bacterium]|nr:M48 family metallopeptidase [Chloroflexota bacterium]
MADKILIGEIPVEVEFKAIKNIHLSVYPPDGDVRVAAPERMDLDIIRLYIISKIGWIKQQQRKFQAQKRETPREYLDIESHYVWGKRYLLNIIEADQAPSVQLKHDQLILTVRPGSDLRKREEVVAAWYREEIRRIAAPLFEKWEDKLGVNANKIIVQWMKTKWGSCNPVSKNIHLNTELAKKPEICLEYIIIHELIHLIEPSHNAYFISLMDEYMPNWKYVRDELNRAPLGHVEWGY